MHYALKAGFMLKNNSLISKPHKTERGQSLVEMAFSLIILLTLLAGAVDFGIALFSYVSIRDAAQEGALYGAINPDNTTEIIARVRTSSSSPVDLSDTSKVTVAINYSSANHCEGLGDTVEVVVSYPYQLIMPILPGVLGISEISLSASVTDAILKPPC